MLTPSIRLTSRPGTQRGSFLIEALIGILIFSLGILALVGMQAAAISAQSDARYRTEASNLAQQMVNNIWLNVTRTNAAALQASLVNFEHQPTGGACNFSGTASANALVTDWIDSVTAAGSGLPGATTAMPQIPVNTAAGGYNRGAFTICWLPPRAATPNRHTVVTYVN